MSEGTTIWIFYRQRDDDKTREWFYPVSVPEGHGSEADLIEHVRLNPGTTRVEDLEGKMLWPKLS